MAPTNLQLQLQTLIAEGLNELDIPKEPASLYEPYRYSLDIGGKRIRPLLTLLACGLCNGKIKDALPAALAVEILHNFTLVHDDIMDSADTRRGKASVFKKWDQNIAILSGDVMFADAFTHLEYYGLKSDFSKSEYLNVHQTFTQATVTVCEGQALDMDFVEREQVSHQEYLKMIQGKTAALLAGALKLGAIAAHATSTQQEALFNFGMEMGVAFQIQDDLLDATADPEKFGKKVGGDIFEGKKTYLTILALERANESDSSFIQQVLDSTQPSQTDVDKVLDIMHSLNVIDDIAEEVNQHYNSALHELDDFNDSEYKHELKNLLIFLQNRDH
ncbi:polyprenyl synthetase family protein [Balneola vulgaris]|uniref:polyprenyl synthetase family protein n=1 Tax=Balneola vulgaris TaxID=287535 RepID=UPI00037D1AFE|nr:polyprenyl synthetase family protein [Balneola vulgaris]